MQSTSPQSRIRRLFTEGFTAIDIAEHLVAFDDDRQATDVLDFLRVRNLRIAGIRSFGAIVGYIWSRELEDGNLSEHVHPIEPEQVVMETAPLVEVIQSLSKFEYCFVEILGSITGIISRSDIEKPPARMWLFGMISLVEMLMARAIETRHPEDSWKDLLSEGRRKKAEELLVERQRRKQVARLIDCLQFNDKGDLFLRDEELFSLTEFESVRAGQKAFKRLSSLRNSLAHSQEIVSNDWEAIVDLAGRVHGIVDRI